MSLADVFAAVEAAVQPKLRAEVVLDELDAADAEFLRAKLHDPSFPVSRIMRAMTVAGITLSDNAIAKYRQRYGIG